jgi:hypothetical protein
MGATQRKVPSQFPRLSSRSQHRGRFFFSCEQYERETLPDFLRRFLQLKAQAPEVSDEQAIMQAIKALHAGQLNSHLVREHLRTLEELYDNFRMFSRFDVLHFRKLGQQRKIINENKSSRPTKVQQKQRGHIEF